MQEQACFTDSAVHFDTPAVTSYVAGTLNHTAAERGSLSSPGHYMHISPHNTKQQQHKGKASRSIT